MSTTVKTQEARKEVQKLALEVSRVYKSDFQKEKTLTAELKQTVVTKSFYPSKSVSSNLSDNPFSNEAFGFKDQEYESKEVRVVWIDVPENSTVDSVKATLANLADATLYKILANKPILSDNQIYGIKAGLTTQDAIGDKQAVRYPKTHAQADQLILDSLGKPQYRGIYFKTSNQEDVDMRTMDPADFYATATMKAELAGAMTSINAAQDAL